MQLILNIVQLFVTVVLAVVFDDAIYICIAFAVLSAVLLTFLKKDISQNVEISQSQLPSIRVANEVTSVYYEDISPLDIAQLEQIYSSSDEERLINLIMLENIEETKELLRRSFDTLEEVGGGREMANYLATNIIRTFVKLISNIKLTDNNKYKFDDLLKIIKLDTVENMKQALVDVADDICCEVRLGKFSTDKTIGERVKSFVEQNYSNHNLDVSKIGDYLGLSPSYATKLFKQETGEVLSNYINRYRVEKAKELLMLNVHRMEQIARMVGYLDARALNRAFKRLYGLTPSQYKDIASIESEKTE